MERVHLHANSPTCAFWLTRPWVAVGVKAVLLRTAFVVLLRAEVAAFALAVPFQSAFLAEPTFSSRGLARSPSNASGRSLVSKTTLGNAAVAPYVLLRRQRGVPERPNARAPQRPNASRPERPTGRTSDALSPERSSARQLETRPPDSLQSDRVASRDLGARVCHIVMDRLPKSLGHVGPLFGPASIC